MKTILALCLTLALNAFAHDEGHGPKISDTPKQGGILTSVVLAKDAAKGPAAEMIYKSEIVRSADGKVSVYFYDKHMKPVKGSLGTVASGVLESGKKGKETYQKFELKFVTDHFEGQAPKAQRKPYNIDIKVKEGERELLAAFDNLD